MARLTLSKVVKPRGSHIAVRGIDLRVAHREFAARAGPSGRGRSTTPRMIADLEHISGGQIRIDDQTVNDLGPGQRDTAMVFQSYALCPHMTVRENISFCLAQIRISKAERQARILRAAETLDITAPLDRRAGQLSGGQRQPVAMGRAIVRNPKMFLFGEPLSNLDVRLRVQMRTEIKRLHRILPTTTVSVTHDRIEAMTMADRVVVMNGRGIEQAGSPKELYLAPRSLFVAGFIASSAMNILPARLVTRGGGRAIVLETGLELEMPASMIARFSAADGDVTFGLRPEAITPRQDRPGFAPVDAVSQLVEPSGPRTMVYFQIGGTTLCATLEPEMVPPPGSAATLSSP